MSSFKKLGQKFGQVTTFFTFIFMLELKHPGHKRVMSHKELLQQLFFRTSQDCVTCNDHKQLLLTIFTVVLVGS